MLPAIEGTALVDAVVITSLVADVVATTRLVEVVEALGELEVPAVATSGEEEDSSDRPREGTTAATAEGLEVE